MLGEKNSLKRIARGVEREDPYLAGYQGGALGLQALDWSILVDGRTVQDLPDHVPEVYRHLPLSTMDEAAGRFLPETFRA